MLNRRGFLRHAAAVTTGCICVGCGLQQATAQAYGAWILSQANQNLPVKKEG